MFSKKKKFSKCPLSFPLPDLIAFQIESYKKFLKESLKELFQEFFPIKDYTEKAYDLHFIGYALGDLKYKTPLEARMENDSFGRPLRVKFRLINKILGKEEEGEVFFCEMPEITERGTFVVNGVERVCVSQLMRSPGVFFVLSFKKSERRFFGAKIIPARGAWIELDTDSQGVIWAKIDKRRRIPASALLRAFGCESNEEILEIFEKERQEGEIDYIEETLKKDKTKSQIEAQIEIFRSLRPGELPTKENAKTFFENLFFNYARYNLSEVGRWRMQYRLNRPFKEPISRKDRFLKKEDLIEVIKEIIRLNNDPLAEPDNIDHLGCRRVRRIGELLEMRLRLGMMRMERQIKNRMSIVKPEEASLKNIVYPKPFASQVREFFMLFSLSQFMDNTNPLSELEHKRRLSAMGPGGLTRERAGFEVRDVQPSHYGRICPIQTPEGKNVGLVVHLDLYSRFNKFGFLETPYFKVEKHKVTNKIEYLNAYEEENTIIASAAEVEGKEKEIKKKRVEARVKGRPSIVSSKEIKYVDVSPQQILSVSSSLIPFLERDDANRALMGSNMQRQAVPLIKSEPPLVATGFEKVVAENSRLLVEAKEEGKVLEVDGKRIVISEKGGKKKEYLLQNFVRTNQFTTVHQKPLVKKGEYVKKGKVLVESYGISQGQIGLGKNLLCAFMPWRGYNYEDAIIVSERLLKEDTFTSCHIENFSCDVTETKLGPEITTNDIPNVSERKLRNLDENGFPIEGAEMEAGDILVGKISPKGEEELSPEEVLLRKIFGEEAKEIKDTSLYLPHGKRGKVIRVKVFKRKKGSLLEPGVIKRIQVEIGYLRRLTVGDKLAGRHGNKGVIAKILPEEDMPFLEDGRPVDIVLNPLSVASRMNLGQIYETHLGFAAKKLGYQAICPPFDGASEGEIKEELKKAGLPEDGKVKLYDGRTGLPFKEKVTVGVIYMMKLIHMVEDKIHARAIGPYSLITQQPLGGKALYGGQRFGEMEVWALEGYGAAYSLQEMLTIKSDDVLGRTNAYETIIRGKEIEQPRVPSSFNVLVCELRSLGLNIQKIKKKYKK